MGDESSGDEKRGLAKTVLGWFVVDDDKQTNSSGGGDAEALIAKYADAPTTTAVPQLTGPLPAVIEGKVNFDQVFDAASIDPNDRGRVDKARELLRSLPVDTPQPTKKQIVEASLRAFGIPTEKIIETSVAEIGALEAFIQKGQSETQAVLSESNQRIAELEQQIAEVRTVMQQALTDQDTRVRAANDAKLAVQQVLEFFGQAAVAKVVQESSKLHQP